MTDKNSNTIIIRTNRLCLRLLQFEDIDNLTMLNSDPDVRQFLPDIIQNREQTETRVRELIQFYADFGLPGFVIFELTSGEFVGECGFETIDGEVEVGYQLHKKFWGKGYATEALRALLAWAKQHIEVEHIIAITPADHSASQRVIDKCGMENYKNEQAFGINCCFYRIENK